MTFLFLLSQLEERIDTLSKEARAHKSSSEASQILISELREELTQVSVQWYMVCVLCSTLDALLRENRVVHLWYISQLCALATQPVRVAEWLRRQTQDHILLTM